NDRARIPSTLEFLTGGDATVRGYDFRAIGTKDNTGTTVAGRYMGVASVELQHPCIPVADRLRVGLALRVSLRRKRDCSQEHSDDAGREKKHFGEVLLGKRAHRRSPSEAFIGPTTREPDTRFFLWV
ncbi:MAG: BamA/TamA family outer membrane protein, partial [Acidobacteriota bacterium]